MVSNRTAPTLIVVGLFVFFVGVAMPAETTESVDVTVMGEEETIQRQTSNEYRAPTMVGGVMIVLVGLVLWNKDSMYDSQYGARGRTPPPNRGELNDGDDERGERGEIAKTANAVDVKDRLDQTGRAGRR